jgi:hypothetical protein
MLQWWLLVDKRIYYCLQDLQGDKEIGTNKHQHCFLKIVKVTKLNKRFLSNMEGNVQTF